MSNVLHYRGDCRMAQVFDPNLTLGPDMHGAHYKIIAAEYDPSADITTVTLRPIPPAELQQRGLVELLKWQERARLRELFGAASA